METLCKIRDVYRAIAEFEVQFTPVSYTHLTLPTT